MKKVLCISLSLISCVTLNHSFAHSYYIPRFSIWGFAGTESQGYMDTLVPVASSPGRMLYTDGQAGVAVDEAWFAGLGGGYRQVVHNAIYGGYLFFDYNKSKKHNKFPVLSPGIEALFPYWDFRFNGYIPLSERHKKDAPYFPSGQNIFGEVGDTSFMMLQGHQLYEHRFYKFEEVGPGADAEIGYTFHRLNNAQLHGGVYHFSFEDVHSINGIESRFEIPINSNWAFALQANYDNQQHGSIVAGLRFNLGGIPTNLCGSTNVHSRMLDPIPRNLGSLHTGSGIPVVHGKKDEGFVLRLDHIYFFSGAGSFTFNTAALPGTYENPFSFDQFTQTLINSIGNDATFFFNPGRFPINNDPSHNGRVSLLASQSLFGRSLDYKKPAAGIERPSLLGGLDLFAGNNHLDSIQLENSSIGSANQLIALHLENARSVNISNSIVDATTEVTGINSGQNFAAGIYANNSDVTITRSIISAHALVDGNNTGRNFAAGMGGNIVLGTANFTGNTFNISSSGITGVALVAGDNELTGLFTQNSGSGIGGNTSVGTANTANNTFNITNSFVRGEAIIGVDNGNFNFASGLGGNSFGGSVEFVGNTFNIYQSSISSLAKITRDSPNYINSAAGIGGNIRSDDGVISSSMVGNGDFIGNTFNIKRTNINGVAQVLGDNTSLNFSNGIGGNANATATGTGFTSDAKADFINNTFDIMESSIIGFSENGTSQEIGLNDFNNRCSGIGGNSRTRGFNGIATATSDFTNNTFQIRRAFIEGSAQVNGENAFLNYGNGLGGIASTNAWFLTVPATRADSNFTNNTFDISESVIRGSTKVGLNSVETFTTSIGGIAHVIESSVANANFINNKFTINHSTLEAEGIITGNNASGFQFITGIGGDSHVTTMTPGVISDANFVNNQISMDSSTLNAIGIVNGDNDGFNFSTTIGGNEGNGGHAMFDFNAPLNITNSLIQVTALIKGNNTVNGFNSVIGVRMDTGNLMNILKSAINLTAIINGINSGDHAVIEHYAGPGSSINIIDTPIHIINIVGG